MGREFNERVRKKSFIITTILMPLLMAALMVAPSLIMLFAKGETKKIVVVDESGIVAPALESNETVEFVTCAEGMDAAREEARDMFGVLWIGGDIVANPSNVKLYANTSSSVTLEEAITSQMEDIIENHKLKAYDIDNLSQILDDVHTDVSLTTYRTDKSDSEGKAESAGLSAGLGFIMGMVLYFFLILYGSMVMQSVIEEKSSRVMEVLVSTVRPFDLMMGKILGVAAVAAVQIVIWGVLICGTGALLLPAIMPDDVMSAVTAVQSGAMDVSQSGMDANVVAMVSTVTDAGYIGKMFLYLLLFVIGGYLLYSAMFAAVGSAVDSVQDASQLQTPIMVPIILALLVMMTILNDPNSAIAVWCSYIPFTSPVVMMARIPSGVPAWEIALSLVLLFATFVLFVWLAGKIYRVGILMYGKKVTFKDLWKWLRY